MSPSRAPWWMYIVAAPLLGLFALCGYSDTRGPGAVGMNLDYRDGSIVVEKVVPNGPGSLRALGTDPRSLQAIRVEQTPLLPGLPQYTPSSLRPGRNPGRAAWSSPSTPSETKSQGLARHADGDGG